MAKLAILAAILALFLAVASASVTITTVEVNGENPTGSQCRQALRGQPLSACQEFLTQGCECGCQDCHCQSRTGLAMMRGDTCRSQLKQCCNELERMDDEFMCQGIKSIVHKLQQQEQSFRGEEMQDMVQQAKKLPSVCGLTPKRCDNIRAVWF